jgi:hypothetical protein
MAGKESEQQFAAINRDANVADNRDILRFLPELRQRLGELQGRHEPTQA